MLEEKTIQYRQYKNLLIRARSNQGAIFQTNNELLVFYSDVQLSDWSILDMFILCFWLANFQINGLHY